LASGKRSGGAAGGGAKLINWTEPEYPQTLLQIYDPPVMLVRGGDAQILNEPTISIVGTPAAYGVWNTDGGAAGAELAKRGLVIVSGLARGWTRWRTRGRWRLAAGDWRDRDGHRCVLPQGE